MMEATKKVDPLIAALNGEAQRHAAEEAEAAPPTQDGTAPGSVAAGDAAQTAALLVMILDLAIVNLVSKNLAISPAEKAMLAEAAAPVVRQYLPPELFLGPVGALVMVAGTIYAPKMLAFIAEPPASESTVNGAAQEVGS